MKIRDRIFSFIVKIENLERDFEYPEDLQPDRSAYSDYFH